VPSFRASALARADLREIGAYTIHRWDEAQADKYLGELDLPPRRWTAGLCRKSGDV
jgi:hypothetical protein